MPAFRMKLPSPPYGGFASCTSFKNCDAAAELVILCSKGSSFNLSKSILKGFEGGGCIALYTSSSITFHNFTATDISINYNRTRYIVCSIWILSQVLMVYHSL